MIVTGFFYVNATFTKVAFAKRSGGGRKRVWFDKD